MTSPSGITLSCLPKPIKRWIVVAGKPVDSLIRFAALPVGEQSLTLIFIRLAQSMMRFKIVVLPQPAPPVKQEIRLFNTV